MHKRDLSDNEAWEALLNDTFGGGQTDTPPEKPEPQPAVPTPENTPLEPAIPKKRRLWPFVTVVAAVLILAALFLLQPWERLSPELQMCKNALEQWQSYESYHITEQRQFYGDGNSMTDSFTLDHYRLGDNRIRIAHRVSYDKFGIAHPAMHGIMVKDGQYYHIDTVYSQGQLLSWEPTTPLGFWSVPWPISFQWKNEKILSCQAQYYESGAVEAVVVTFLDDASDAAYESNIPSNAIFFFTEAGDPGVIILQQTFTNDHYGSALNAHIYRLQDFHSDSIAAAFQNPPTD